MKKWIYGILGFTAAIIALLIYNPIGKTVALMATQPLKGTVIVIDAGHGGYDPGATTSSVDEADINLEISLKLKKILEAAGAKVVMIRETDIDFADNAQGTLKRADLSERLRIFDESNATLFISIHGNTSFDRNCKGAEAYYKIGDPNSQALAASIMERLRPITNSKFLPKKGDFYLLNNSEVLGVIVEVGFLTNATDLKNLQSSQYQEDVAYGIFEGISDFLKILQ